MHSVMHWIGVFLLIVSFALIIVSTVTAPVVHELGMLKFELSNGVKGYFGTFGYCLYAANDAAKRCSGVHVGYKISHVLAGVETSSANFTGEGTADVLTNAMVLHPIAAGVTFIAFLLAFIPGAGGAIVSSFVTFLAFLTTVIAMALDFALFGIIKAHFNNDSYGTTASYSVGSWTILAAMVLLFFASFFILFSCCGRRREQKQKRSEAYEYKGGAGGAYNGGQSY